MPTFRISDTDIAPNQPVGPAIKAWLDSLPKQGTAGDPITAIIDGDYCYDQLLAGASTSYQLRLTGKVHFGIEIPGLLYSRAQVEGQRGGCFYLDHWNYWSVAGNIDGGADSHLGYDADRENWHSVWVMSSYNGQISIDAIDPWGDAVYIGPDVRTGTRPAHITLTECTLHGKAHRHAVSITAGDDIQIVGDNKWGTTVRGTYDIEPNGAMGIVNGVAIKGSQATHHGGYWLACMSDSGSVKNVDIEGNAVTEHDISMWVAGDAGMELADWKVIHNVGATGVGKGKDEATAGVRCYKGVNNIVDIFNRNPIQMNRPVPMHAARFTGCTGIEYHDNWPVDDS